MKAVVQRVSQASVTVAGESIGTIDEGLTVLLGVEKTDSDQVADRLAKKIVNLRIFEGPGGKLDQSILETGGDMLIVSQFTLLGDCRKGRRPSFDRAAPPDLANPLYEEFCKQVETFGVKVARGRFGATMQVQIYNEGPVTLIIEMSK